MTENLKATDVYFSLGSNLGNRMENLTLGLLSLERIGERIAVSSIVETPAWGYDDPNAYLNLAAHFRMNLTPKELRLKIIEIESEMGRDMRDTNQTGYEARTLDIDILFYDDLILNTPELQIPHPRLHLRNFVLYPLAEIAHNKIHPELKLSIAEMLASSPDKSSLQRFADGV